MFESNFLIKITYLFIFYIFSVPENVALIEENTDSNEDSQNLLQEIDEEDVPLSKRRQIIQQEYVYEPELIIKEEPLDIDDE